MLEGGSRTPQDEHIKVDIISLSLPKTTPASAYHVEYTPTLSVTHPPSLSQSLATLGYGMVKPPGGGGPLSQAVRSLNGTNDTETCIREIVAHREVPEDASHVEVAGQ